MKIANRSIKKILLSAFEKRHWIALKNMINVYENFPDSFLRYFFARGSYPHQINIRVKKEKHTVLLYCHDDMLTVNEIFCRQDYHAERNIKNVVDIGSNIGISALYFLTQNNYCKCYLYEPVPQNIEKLKLNLKGFENRYHLTDSAVSDQSGVLKFGIEQTGRYGGIGIETGEYITVNCKHINDVLSDAFEKCDFIDILKIDTEGVEVKTVLAIKNDYLNRIGKIYIEAHPSQKLLDKSFEQKQYGSVCQFFNRSV